jgi:hypothetical protein
MFFPEPPPPVTLTLPYSEYFPWISKKYKEELRY